MRHSLPTLTEEHRDALKEAGNIGAATAAAALSQLIGDRIMINVPEVYVGPQEKIPGVVGGDDDPVLGVQFRIMGGVRGIVLVIFSRESWSRLRRFLFRGGKGSGGDIETSALKETCNILTASYLNALGSILGLTLIPSVPFFAHDMTGALLDGIVASLARKSEAGVVVKTEFLSVRKEMKRLSRKKTSQGFSGFIIMLPEPASLRKIIEGLRRWAKAAIPQHNVLTRRDG